MGKNRVHEPNMIIGWINMKSYKCATDWHMDKQTHPPEIKAL